VFGKLWRRAFMIAILFIQCLVSLTWKYVFDREGLGEWFLVCLVLIGMCLGHLCCSGVPRDVKQAERRPVVGDQRALEQHGATVLQSYYVVDASYKRDNPKNPFVSWHENVGVGVSVLALIVTGLGVYFDPSTGEWLYIPLLAMGFMYMWVYISSGNATWFAREQVYVVWGFEECNAGLQIPAEEYVKAHVRYCPEQGKCGGACSGLGSGCGGGC
jgi:hypothetical protein